MGENIDILYYSRLPKTHQFSGNALSLTKKPLSNTLTDVITRRPPGAATTLPYLISSTWFIKENLIPCLGKAKIGHIVNQLRFLGIYRVDPHLIKAINVLLRTPSEVWLRNLIIVHSCGKRKSVYIKYLQCLLIKVIKTNNLWWIQCLDFLHDKITWVMMVRS